MRLYPPNQDKIEGRPLHFRDVEDAERIEAMKANGWTDNKLVSLGIEKPVAESTKADEPVEDKPKRRGRPKKED